MIQLSLSPTCSATSPSKGVWRLAFGGKCRRQHTNYGKGYNNKHKQQKAIKILFSGWKDGYDGKEQDRVD